MEIKFKVIKNKTKKYKESDRLPLYVRLVDGRAFDQTAKTSIMVSPLLWHADREEMKARSVCSQEVEKPCARDPRSPVPLTLAVQNSLTL